MTDYSRMPGPGDLPGDASHPGSPDFNSSRDEWIDERATAIRDAKLADHDAVTEAVEQVIGFSDWTDTLAGQMAQVLTASDAAFDAEAARFFAQLYKRVRSDIADEAKAQAEQERDRWEAEQTEIRDFYRGKAA